MNSYVFEEMLRKHSILVHRFSHVYSIQYTYHNEHIGHLQKMWVLSHHELMGAEFCAVSHITLTDLKKKLKNRSLMYHPYKKDKKVYVEFKYSSILNIFDGVDYNPIRELAELIKADKKHAIMNVKHENEYIRKLSSIRLKDGD